MVTFKVCKKYDTWCSDCTGTRCLHAGDPGADCPRYHCVYPEEYGVDCAECKWLKRYKEETEKNRKEKRNYGED